MPDRQERPRLGPVQRQQGQYITRTRQDLINSGDLFRMNEKFAAEERERKFQQNSSRLGNAGTGAGGQVSECCHCVCNLALVGASVISIFLLASFLRDEPLYEYGEYLLGLAFYRELIFVLVLAPLLLLLPLWNLFNALLAMGGGGGGRLAAPAGLLKLRLAATFLLFALALLALIFVAPYISRGSVASQIEFEFRRFLKMRYESEFHYQLLDRLQEAYECCDHMWYRANLQDKVPISCFKPGSHFNLIYDDTCPEVLGALVSTRCAILSACLSVALLALGCLFAMDCERLFGRAAGGPGAGRRGEYEVAPTTGGGATKHKLDSNGQLGERGRLRTAPAIGGELAGQAAARAREVDDERELPLLAGSPADSGNLSATMQLDECEHSDDQSPEATPPPLARESTQSRRSRFLDRDAPEANSPVLLTRADFRTIQRERSQSPKFVSPAPASSPQPQLPIKSALKSGSSQQSLSERHGPDGAPPAGQRFDDDEDEDSLVNDYAERLRKSDSLLRQKQQLRREQLRKSLQSVRFADDNA